MLALDIGCGSNKAPGALGVDVARVPGVDVVSTLQRLTFRDSIADVVYLSHVLEHVDSLVATLEEVWRVAKPGATVHVWCPHFTCGLYVWSDPTHRRAFASTTFDYFDPEAPLKYYSSARLRVMRRELHFGFRREVIPVRGLGPTTSAVKRMLGRVLEPLANRSRVTQILCERTWGNWVGFEEVYFRLSVLKKK